MKIEQGCLAEHYRELGYYAPNYAISETEAADILSKLQAHERVHGPLKALKPHLLFTWLDALVRNRNILDVVETLVGPDILCWSSSFFAKEARSNKFVSWHQDGNYIGLQPNEMVTAWIALTPSNAGNGAMRVIPRTHRKAIAHQETFVADNLLSRGQEIQADIDASTAVTLELKPGEFSLHSTLIVHGSDPNPSDGPRVGFVVRYIPTRVRQTQSDSDSALLVRGVDDFRHFAPERSPDGDFTPSVRAYHASIDRGPHGLKK